WMAITLRRSSFAARRWPRRASWRSNRRTLGPAAPAVGGTKWPRRAAPLAAHPRMTVRRILASRSCRPGRRARNRGSLTFFLCLLSSLHLAGHEFYAVMDLWWNLDARESVTWLFFDCLLDWFGDD